MANAYKPSVNAVDTGGAGHASCPICTFPVGRFRRAIPLLACKSCGTPLIPKLPIWANVGWSAMMMLGVLYGYHWVSAEPSRLVKYCVHFALISSAIIVTTKLLSSFFFGRPHPANSWRWLTAKEVLVLRSQYTERMEHG